MLTHLNLRTNALSGSIPAELGSLSSLTVLNLHTNQLTGPIPNLSDITGLEELYLPNNMLTGPVPAWLNGMTDMRQLWLWGNELRGTIPDLSGMTSLQKLKLAKNNLTGGIPASLSSMSNLKWLIIDTNPLGGTIPNLGGMTSLTHLWLHTNGLEREIPTSLGLLPNLDDLNLRNNDLTGRIPDLSSLDTLTRLRLHNNMLSGEIPATLGDLDSLQSPWLHGNMLSGSIPASLGRLGKLENLWLRENKLSGEIPAALGLLSYYNLVRLRLAGNQFTGCLPALLRDVADNDLDDIGLQDCEPAESEPPLVEPCIQTEETCSRRDVSRPVLLGLGIILFLLDPGNSVEKLLGSSTHIAFSPNPPKDTDGRREDRGRGVRELQGGWPGLHYWGRWEVSGRSSAAAQGPYGRLRELGCAGWRENTQQGTLADRDDASLRGRWVSCRLGVEWLAAGPRRD